MSDNPLKFKKTTDYITANPWLDDDPEKHESGFELSAMLIHRLVKTCLGDKEIPDYDLCLQASERRLAVIGEIGLEPAEVHAALAKHYLQKALKAHAMEKYLKSHEVENPDPDLSAMVLTTAGISIGRSIENADNILRPMLEKELKASQQRVEAGSKPQPFAEAIRALLREKTRHNKKQTLAKIWQDLPGEYPHLGIYEITNIYRDAEGNEDASRYGVILSGKVDEKPLSQRQVKERLREIKKEWKKQKIQVTP